MAARESRICIMESCSQEKRRRDGRRNFGLAFCFFRISLLSLSMAVLCTISGASADPIIDEATASDVEVGTSPDKGGDTQSRVDYLKDAERERKEIRERRDARREELEMKARHTRSLYDPFDGSEFKKKTFIDTDFRKQSFTDLGAVKHRSDTRPDDDASRTKDLFGKTADDRTSYFYAREKKKRDLREKLRDDLIMKDLTKAIPGVLHDWVPKGPDPMHNGGFEREEDNGHPVPYHLNGHPDFQRKLPWAE